MELAKITAKGQITLPIAIRKVLNLRDGDKVAFIERNGEFVLANPSMLALERVREAFDGEAERIGLKNEEDVVNLIKDIRKEKQTEEISIL